MKIITAEQISAAVAALFTEAARILEPDVERAVRTAAQNESSAMARDALCMICDNLDAARRTGIPICQDTGMAVVFADIGSGLRIDGDFNAAVNEGVRRAYRDGYLRCSIVSDPLYGRVNTGDNTPAIIHTRITEGDSLTLTAAPKGFGSENMSVIRMFTPSAAERDIIDFVSSAVRDAGGNPCPPVIVGVGIGGDFEYCAELSKRALLRPIDDRNPHAAYAALEDKLLAAVNAVGVGAQGFGGIITALAVKVEQAPTHIAGLPVAVNINCHVARHKTVVL